MKYIWFNLSWIKVLWNWAQLDYLPVGYTQRSMLTALYVVRYQSVTRNSNNSSGYAYNSEFITQPTPICHSPSKFKFWIWQLDFCLKLMFLVVLVKIILVSIISVTFNLDACKISFINYLKELFNFEKKRSLMWSMFKIVQKLVPAHLRAYTVLLPL